MRVPVRPPEGGPRRDPRDDHPRRRHRARPARCASDPPGLARFMDAIAHVESHGDYAARNARRARTASTRSCRRAGAAGPPRYLGNANAKPTPANQEIVAAAKFRALYAALGSWRRVAYWWLTGSSRTSGWSSAATRYVTRVMAAYRDGVGTEVTVPTAAREPPRPRSTLRRYSETSAAIAYSGAVEVRELRALRRAARRSTRPRPARRRRSGSPGSKVVWYGPVGPTRGKARVRIDGAVVDDRRPVRHRRSRRARRCSARRWSTAGSAHPRHRGRRHVPATRTSRSTSSRWRASGQRPRAPRSRR